MSVAGLSAAAAAGQVARVRGVAAFAQRAWEGVDPAAPERSWAPLWPQVAAALVATQQAAASAAATHVLAQAAEQAAGLPVAAVAPAGFAGTAANGASLAALLAPAVATIRIGELSGLTPTEAKAAGLLRLTRIVAEEARAAWYNATQAQQTATPGLTGYVRRLRGASCSRCVILAGRWYRWSDGFDRHTGCDCEHVAVATAATGRDLRTDPRGYFDSLTPAQQDAAFGKAGAQAIRDGADMSQVVNVKRGSGLYTHEVGDGRRLQATYEATTIREGRAGRRLAQASGQGRGRALEAFERADTARLTPRSIYELADGDRDRAIDLLRQYGYLDPTPIRRTARAATRDLGGAA